MFVMLFEAETLELYGPKSECESARTRAVCPYIYIYILVPREVGLQAGVRLVRELLRFREMFET